MIKIYCDVCGDLIDYKRDRVRRAMGKVVVEVMVSYDNVWNGGQICDGCVIKTINEGRPVGYAHSWLANANKSVAS